MATTPSLAAQDSDLDSEAKFEVDVGTDPASYIEPIEHPDGGFEAWLVVFGASLFGSGDDILTHFSTCQSVCVTFSTWAPFLLHLLLVEKTTGWIQKPYQTFLWPYHPAVSIAQYSQSC
jgi:hypothetical protein